MIRHKIICIPLSTAFSSVDKKTDGAPMTIPLRGEEHMYILPYADRVMVTFSVHFDDPSDSVLGKVFLQEFYDTRQKHTVQNSPIVIYGKEIPAEMTPLIPAGVKAKMNFISFGTFKLIHIHHL